MQSGRAYGKYSTWHTSHQKRVMRASQYTLPFFSKTRPTNAIHNNHVDVYVSVPKQLKLNLVHHILVVPKTQQGSIPHARIHTNTRTQGKSSEQLRLAADTSTYRLPLERLWKSEKNSA